MALRTYRKLNAQSAKAKAREQILDEVRPLVFARDGYRCRIGLSPECTGQAEELHHKRLRSQGGLDTPDNLIAACHYCHRWCHNHPALAREAGVIV